jgi:hypothetical protein
VYSVVKLGRRNHRIRGTHRTNGRRRIALFKIAAALVS